MVDINTQLNALIRKKVNNMKRIYWMGKAADLKAILKDRNEVNKEFEKIPLLQLIGDNSVIVTRVANGQSSTVFA